MYCWCRPTEKLNSEQIRTLVQHCCCRCFSEVSACGLRERCFREKIYTAPRHGHTRVAFRDQISPGATFEDEHIQAPKPLVLSGWNTFAATTKLLSKWTRPPLAVALLFLHPREFKSHQLRFQCHSLVRLCPLLGEAVAAMPHLCVRVDFNSYGWVFPFWNHSLISELENK